MNINAEAEAEIIQSDALLMKERLPQRSQEVQVQRHGFLGKAHQNNRRGSKGELGRNSS